MGLIGTGLVASVYPVFAFLQSVWIAFPIAIRLLVTASFTSVVFIAVLRSIHN